MMHGQTQIKFWTVLLLIIFVAPPVCIYKTCFDRLRCYFADELF